VAECSKNKMRHRRFLTFAVCVSLVLIVVYTALQQNTTETVTVTAAPFYYESVNETETTTSSCYGSVEELRHLIHEDRFQARRVFSRHHRRSQHHHSLGYCKKVAGNRKYRLQTRHTSRID